MKLTRALKLLHEWLGEAESAYEYNLCIRWSKVTLHMQYFNNVDDEPWVILTDKSESKPLRQFKKDQELFDFVHRK